MDAAYINGDNILCTKLNHDLVPFQSNWYIHLPVPLNGIFYGSRQPHQNNQNGMRILLVLFLFVQTNLLLRQNKRSWLL